jgi:hypothetical protein
MKNTIFYSWILLPLLLLSACSTVPTPPDLKSTPHTTQPSIAECTGAIATPPPGLVPTDDPALLQRAVGEAKQGKLCTGQVFIAKATILVYRIWDQAKPGSLYGSWWSFQPPTGNREQYRIDNAICPEWSALNVLSVCQIKIGSKLVLGPGQSAKCSETLSYPASPVNQVYLPNNLQQNLLQVENCSTGTLWPAD